MRSSLGRNEYDEAQGENRSAVAVILIQTIRVAMGKPFQIT